MSEWRNVCFQRRWTDVVQVCFLCDYIVVIIYSLSHLLSVGNILVATTRLQEQRASLLFVSL